MKRAPRGTVLVPVVTIDADAGASPKARAAGTALVRLACDAEYEFVTDLAMDARNALEDAVSVTMVAPDSYLPSVLTDIVIRHVVSKLTGPEVLAMIQADPEVVLEAERLVEELKAARKARCT